MQIKRQELGVSFLWMDAICVTPLSITRGRVSLGIWLNEAIDDAQLLLETMRRIRSDGYRYWLYPSGGPRMLAVQLRLGQWIRYGHHSQISIQSVGADRLTLHQDDYCQSRIDAEPYRVTKSPPSQETLFCDLASSPVTSCLRDSSQGEIFEYA